MNQQHKMIYNMDNKEFFKKFSMIVASSENGAIGKDNQLLWSLPNDLKRFKKLTDNKIVIMGKNTYMSLPNGVLPNRLNIVLCNDDDDFLNSKEEIMTKNTAMVKLKEMDDVFDFVYNFINTNDSEIKNSSIFNTDEIFIMGGGKIYELFLPYINKIHLTTVHTNIEDADTFIPNLSNYNWNLLYSEKCKKDDKHKFDYTFLEIEKIYE